MTGERTDIRLPEATPSRIHAAVAAASASWHIGGTAGGVDVVADGDWPSSLDAAIARGAESILLVGVPPGLARENEIPVVVELGWNHDPAAIAAAPEFARLLDAEQLLEATALAPSGSSLQRVLLGQLTLLRTVVGRISDIRVVRADRTGYDMYGSLECGARVALSALFSDALQEAATIRLVTPGASVQLELTPPALADPGIVRMVDDAGSHTLPTVWETSAKMALRMLGDSPSSEPLAALVDDYEQVAVLALERHGSVEHA